MTYFNPVNNSNHNFMAERSPASTLEMWSTQPALSPVQVKDSQRELNLSTSSFSNPQQEYGFDTTFSSNEKADGYEAPANSENDRLHQYFYAQPNTTEPSEVQYSQWVNDVSSPEPEDDFDEDMNSPREPKPLDERLLTPFSDQYTRVPKHVIDELKEAYFVGQEYISPADLFNEDPRGITRLVPVIDLTGDDDQEGRPRKYAMRMRAVVYPEEQQTLTASYSPMDVSNDRARSSSPQKSRKRVKAAHFASEASERMSQPMSTPAPHASIWDEVLAKPLTEKYHLGSRAGVATLLILHTIRHPVHYWPDGISRNGLLDIASQLFPETARRYDEKVDHKRFWRSISDMIGGWKKGGEGRNPTPYLRVAGKGGPRNITMYLLTEKGVQKAWQVMASEGLEELVLGRIKMVEDWQAEQEVLYQAQQYEETDGSIFLTDEATVVAEEGYAGSDLQDSDWEILDGRARIDPWMGSVGYSARPQSAAPKESAPIGLGISNLDEIMDMEPTYGVSNAMEVNTEMASVNRLKRPFYHLEASSGAGIAGAGGRVVGSCEDLPIEIS